MTSIARLDQNKDWVMGRGNANYIRGVGAVLQSLESRIKFFVNDWYADINYGIDWLNLLGTRGNQKAIRDEIERITLNTQGIATIEQLEVILLPNGQRQAQIIMRVTTVFDNIGPQTLTFEV